MALILNRNIMSIFFLQARSLKNFYRYSSQIKSNRSWLEQYRGGSVDLVKDETTGIAMVTLNQPDKMNALTGKMMIDLADIAEELDQWQGGKGFVLHGAAETFCSGGDLGLVQKIFNPTDGGRMCEFMQHTCWRLFTLPLVSVALLEGRVLGGGAELAVACDFRLVTDTAKIGFVQSKMGVSPGWGGGTRLVQLLGRTNALELLVSGKLLNCDDAISRGLATDKVPSNSNHLEYAKDWLLKHVKSDVAVTRVLKQLVVDALSSSTLEESLAHERKLFESLWGGKAHHTAMTSNVKHK